MQFDIDTLVFIVFLTLNFVVGLLLWKRSKTHKGILFRNQNFFPSRVCGTRHGVREDIDW